MLHISFFLLSLTIISRDLISAIEPNSQNIIRSLNLTLQRNTRFENLDAFVLNSFVDIPFDQCIRECTWRPGCAAVEYQHNRKYCSLSAVNLTTVIMPGSLTVSGFSEVVVCGDITCNSKEACDAQAETCMVKECGFPGIGLGFTGNRVDVGSKLTRTCSDGLEYTTCTNSGDWLSQRHVGYSGLTCRDVRLNNTNVRSGPYTNRLNMMIYCDFDTDGGDWLVFQRRFDGSEDFYRTWQDYKSGFGDVCGEFWFGLENLNTIFSSSSSTFEVRFDLEDWSGNKKYAAYDTFSIGGESDGYRLSIGTYSGTAKDAIHTGQEHHGQKFSTYDNDNDSAGTNCAERFHGAWWYNACHTSNLNGRYFVGGNTTDRAEGVVWFQWRGHYYSLKKTSIKMREKQPISP